MRQRLRTEDEFHPLARRLAKSLAAPPRKSWPDYWREKLIDAFQAAVRRHGLDSARAVQFAATHGLQRPAIADKPAAELPSEPTGAEAA